MRFWMSAAIVLAAATADLKVGTTPGATIGVIATNARLTKAQAAYLAQITDDGYARAIWPIHTLVDATRCSLSRPAKKAGEPDMMTIGPLAADVIATAIIRAATQAAGLPNLPAVRDLR